MRCSNPCRLRGPGRVVWLVMLLALVVTPATAGVQTLLDAYTAASPGSGYDTLLVLDPADIYTGGLTLPAGHHCIVGNGALVNLQGGSLLVEDGAALDISGISLTNGTYGLDFVGAAMGHVECCNFIQNTDGLRAWDTASVTLLSNNFVGNSHYGVYRNEYAPVFNAYNNAWNNGSNDYVYFCPG